MKPASIIAVALAVAAMILAGRAAVQPAARMTMVPDSADTVVLRLGGAAGDIESLMQLRSRLRQDSRNAELAGRFARRALQLYRESGDVRLLGYADGALDHWRVQPQPSLNIWLLRGRILQTQHRFREAGIDLGQLLRAHPGNVEAMLLAADAWRRAGDIAAAKSLCLRLGFAGRPDLARYCSADVLLSLGKADAAFALVAEDSAQLAPEEARWANALLAEAAEASGRFAIAEAALCASLEDGQPDLSSYVAYADLLLHLDRAPEVLPLLDAMPGSVAVLLRRAIAAKRSGLREFPQIRLSLVEALGPVPGKDSLHLRERAMFELRVEGDAAAALVYARRNWLLQKGPEDAALLLEAAGAAGQVAAAEVVDWFRRRYAGAAG